VRNLNAEGKTVIYTTHIMAEADTLCKRVAIIDYGELLAMGTVDELKESLKRDQIIHVEGIIPEAAVSAVRQLHPVQRATRAAFNGGNRLVVVVDEAPDMLPTLITSLTVAGAHIQKIAPEEITLEDVFIAKTGRTLAEDTRKR
jgi:ABC-2 type transport system ATP-binding protein